MIVSEIDWQQYREDKEIVCCWKPQSLSAMKGYKLCSQWRRLGTQTCFLSSLFLWALIRPSSVMVDNYVLYISSCTNP